MRKEENQITDKCSEVLVDESDSDNDRYCTGKLYVKGIQSIYLYTHQSMNAKLCEYLHHTSGMDLNDVTVLVTVNNSYFLTTNSAKRVMEGMWLNDEVHKRYMYYCFYEII
jgi:hypothetical protein